MGEFGSRLAAWWHSLRFQDPEQLAARLRYEAAWLVYPRLTAAARMACEAGARGRRPRADFSWRGRPAAFRFLNPAVQLDERMDWSAAGRPLLWRFHLHYFDWAPHWEPERLARQIEDWIGANPPGSWPGWHPYPTSLRVVNWIRAFGPAMPPGIAASLASQAAFLERHLERHLGGNHLLENARALLAAGLFLEGGPARRWERAGLDLLAAELERQVLADGGHAERSPWYHLRMTGLVEEAVELLASARRRVPDELRSAAGAMRRFARSLVHLDGSLPCFHDGLYAECDRSPVDSEAGSPGAASFPASGYYILDTEQGRLIADYGAPGSCANPGHQHAGIFSFEVSSRQGMVIVDSGTSTYDPGPERERLRSTAAHNTVRVDGRDQFQVWGAFRVGRRARVFAVREVREAKQQWISASHDGYRALGVEHRRSIAAFARAGWLIVDDVLGGGEHRIESFVHLAPGVVPVCEEEAVRLDPIGWRIIGFGFQGPARVADDIYAPGVGDRRPSRTLTFTYRGRLPWRCGFFLGAGPGAGSEWKSSGSFRADDLQLSFAATTTSSC